MADTAREQARAAVTATVNAVTPQLAATVTAALQRELGSGAGRWILHVLLSVCEACIVMCTVSLGSSSQSHEVHVQYTVTVATGSGIAQQQPSDLLTLAVSQCFRLIGFYPCQSQAAKLQCVCSFPAYCNILLTYDLHQHVWAFVVVCLSWQAMQDCFRVHLSVH